MGCRRLYRRVFKRPDDWGVVMFSRGNQHFGRTRRGTGDVAGNALLQQKFGASDHRLGVKPVAQAPILQSIGDRRDRHALMVRHEAADEGAGFPGGQARRREVHRLVESIAPLGSKVGQCGIVLHGGNRVDHCGKTGGVRCDHAVFAKPPFQPQTRHTEVGILVRHLKVAGVVGGLGYSPRDAQPSRVAALAGDHQRGGLLQHRSRRGPHHEGRHQVFKHAARPRDQRRS